MSGDEEEPFRTLRGVLSDEDPTTKPSVDWSNVIDDLEEPGI